MIVRELQPFSVPPTATVRDAMTAIGAGGFEVCLVIGADGRLQGLVTDGDLRRALLAGADLYDAVAPFATRRPHVVTEGTTRAHVLDLMRALRITQVPVLTEDGRVVGLHTLSGVVGADPLPQVAVVMAGGKGTRLGALTANRPKPLMMVAGRSILEWIILNLVSGGIRDVYVSVNYLADMVEDHLQDGRHLGCRVHYLREDPEVPLGTAGSLAILRDSVPDLPEPVLVMNGDLMAQFDVAELVASHQRQGAAVTVASRMYEHAVPFGVIEHDDQGLVAGITEKPTLQMPVNAGIYAIGSAALSLVPAGRPSTLPELVGACLDRGLPVATWTVETDWIDVGTPKDLARAKGQA